MFNRLHIFRSNETCLLPEGVVVVISEVRNAEAVFV